MAPLTLTLSHEGRGDFIKYWAIIPAAGLGRRFGSDTPKQYLMLKDKTILEHTLNVLLSYPLFQKIVVVLASADPYWSTLTLPSRTKERIICVTGGQERYISVYQGLEVLDKIAAPEDWVLVHDAVRPCLNHADLDRLIQALKDHPVGGLLGIPAQDSLKAVDPQQNVQHTVDRSNIWQAQSPQMFRFNKLKQALEKVIREQQSVTDDAGAIQLLGESPLMVEGSRENIKITRPEDLLLAEKFML